MGDVNTDVEACKSGSGAACSGYNSHASVDHPTSTGGSVYATYGQDAEQSACTGNGSLVTTNINVAAGAGQAQCTNYNHNEIHANQQGGAVYITTSNQG